MTRGKKIIQAAEIGKIMLIGTTQTISSIYKLSLIERNSISFLIGLGRLKPGSISVQQGKDRKLMLNCTA